MVPKVKVLKVVSRPAVNPLS